MLDEAVHASLCVLMGGRAHRTGPFPVAFGEHDAGLFRNYGIPDDDARPTPGQVTELIGLFTDHDRTPRLEFLPGLCPAVEPALVEAGFVPERRLPLMTCRAPDAAARAVSQEIQLRLATTDDELRQVADAQSDAYGQTTTTDHDVARLRATIDGGGLVAGAGAVAFDTNTGLGVGGGLCAPPQRGVTELAAVGVRAAYRRRGIATALTVLLTQACAAAGITTPFLTPAGESEARIYRAAGYRASSEMLHISR